MPDTLLGNAGADAGTQTTDNGGAATGGDHWTGKLGVPTDMIDDKIRGFATPKDFLESYRSSQKLISSKGYQRPADDAPPEAWDRFYAATGRPAKADDYKWDAPEGVKIADERMADVRSELHKAGLDSRQFSAVMSLYAKESQAQAQTSERESQELQGKTAATLKAEWGSKDFDARLSKAKAAAQSLGILDVLDRTGLGDHAEVVLAMDRIAAKIGEDSAVRGASSGSVDADIQSLNDRILKLPASDPALPGLEKQRGELFARRAGRK